MRARATEKRGRPQNKTDDEALNVKISREEYDALCAMRDERHTLLMFEYKKLQERYSALVDVNAEQLGRLIKCDLELKHLREALNRSPK